MKVLSAILLGAVLAFVGLSAHAGEGEKIAEKKVNYKSETDTVNPMSAFC